MDIQHWMQENKQPFHNVFHSVHHIQMHLYFGPVILPFCFSLRSPLTIAKRYLCKALAASAKSLLHHYFLSYP